jgi:hypothetical protein
LKFTSTGVNESLKDKEKQLDIENTVAFLLYRLAVHAKSEFHSPKPIEIPEEELSSLAL